MSLHRLLRSARITKRHGCNAKMSCCSRTGISAASVRGRQKRQPLDELRNIIEVRKWQVNQAAGVIFVRMKPFSTSASASGWMIYAAARHSTGGRTGTGADGLSELTAIARNCAIQRATDALRKPFCPGLRRGKKLIIPHRIGHFNDHRIQAWRGFGGWQPWKFTPAQNMIFSRKSAELASRSLCKTPRKSACFYWKKPCIVRCMALHAFSCLISCRSRRADAAWACQCNCIKTALQSGRAGGESTARKRGGY